MTTFDDNFKKAIGAAELPKPPFAVGDRVRTRSGYTGRVENARNVQFYGWHATVKVDAGGSWDGSMTELLAERKKGDKIEVKVTKHSGSLWKEDVNGRKAVGYATWSWAKGKVKAEQARIVVRGYATMQTKANEAGEQIFLPNAASDKAAKEYARKLVASGDAITANVSYQIYVWQHFGGHAQKWVRVEEIDYEASDE
jgi:hypothetical protein